MTIEALGTIREALVAAQAYVKIGGRLRDQVNAAVAALPEVEPAQRAHHYPHPGSFCSYGCGCYRGDGRCSGPEDVNPLGECPCAPKEAAESAGCLNCAGPLHLGPCTVAVQRESVGRGARHAASSTSDCDCDALQKSLEKEERARLQTITERDAYHEAADKLAYTVGGVEEIGEHSNMNDPWENAADLLVEKLERLATLENEGLSVGINPPHLCPNCGNPPHEGECKRTPEPVECCAARAALYKLWYDNQIPFQYFKEANAALATPCECDGLRGIFRYTCGHYRGPGSEAGPCVICTERAQLCARLAAMTADRNQWQRLKDGLEEEKARLMVAASEAIGQAHAELRAELAAALDRERRAVKILRECSKDFAGGYYTQQWRGPLHAKISAIVSEFDAREGK